MKLEIHIPPEVITAIAKKVADTMKPNIATRKAENQDAILTPKQLANHLQTSRQWVYERVSLGEIPHIKVGKYLRFKKSDIDNWIKFQSIPASNPLSRSLKAIK